MSAPAAKPAATPRFSTHEIRSISVEAKVDPRTVRRVLEGDETGSMASERVREVLRRMKPSKGR